MGDQLIGRPQETLRMGEECIAPSSHPEQVNLFRQLIQRIDIVVYMLRLMRELLTEIRYESLPTLRNTVGFVVFEIGDAVHAVGIRRAQHDGLVVQQGLHVLIIIHDVYAQIPTDLPDAPPFTQSAEDMHPRLVAHAMTEEGLQTAPQGVILFQYRHLVTFLGQERPREESAQTAAYHCYSLHALICLKMVSDPMISLQVTMVPTITPKTP